MEKHSNPYTWKFTKFTAHLFKTDYTFFREIFHFKQKKKKKYSIKSFGELKDRTTDNKIIIIISFGSLNHREQWWWCLSYPIWPATQQGFPSKHLTKPPVTGTQLLLYRLLPTTTGTTDNNEHFILKRFLAFHSIQVRFEFNWKPLRIVEVRTSW